jgi:hypothetical protein
MADDNKPLKYMRYAIGEIVLVVIGILIALQINTWNEQRKDKQRTNRLLENVQKELLVNIKETDLATVWYRRKDSLIFKVINKKVTYDDYKSNPRLSNLIYNRYRVDVTEDAFKKLMDFEGKVPKELDSIFIKLKEAFGPDWVSIHENNKLVDDAAISNLKEIENNKKWFADLYYMLKIPDDIILYQLNDTIYRNRVVNYAMITVNHFYRIRLYRNKALSIYEEISDYLDLKKDTTVVKNMNDYEHYIGRYEGDSLFNAQIIRKNNTLKLNLFAKNDTIIIESMRVYPDSKTYSIIGRFLFSQSFFDEDNKVSKIVLSIGPFREELKKID